MSYDLHGSWDNFTGINAPLYPRDDEEGDERYYNVVSTSTVLLSIDASFSK